MVDAGVWPYNFSYVSILGRDDYVFQVVACESVYLELSEVPGNPHTLNYEIALGIDNNAKTEIRAEVGGPAMASHQGQVLDCEGVRAFWVSWDQGYVEVGTGTSVRDTRSVLVSWQDPSPHKVNAMGASVKEGVQASWEFTDRPGQSQHLRYLIEILY